MNKNDQITVTSFFNEFNYASKASETTGIKEARRFDKTHRIVAIFASRTKDADKMRKVASFDYSTKEGPRATIANALMDEAVRLENPVATKTM